MTEKGKKRCYVLAELFGKTSKILTAGAVLTFFVGAAIELGWDFAERKETKKRLTNKK